MRAALSQWKVTRAITGRWDMNRDLNSDHPLRMFFGESLHEALDGVGLADDPRAEEYLLQMLLEFLHNDGIYAIRDAEGRRVKSVADMLAEGDVLLNADSFERERQVHKHIGDFLLFWSGLFPEFLRHLRAPVSKDALIDPVRQGQDSYYVASTFRHDPFGDEAPTLLRLSEEFRGYQESLILLRASFEGFKLQGWEDGFRA
jgi:hypothetical protein